MASAIATMKIAIAHCITMLVENICFIFEVFFRPNSNVINRLIAADSEFEIIPNIETKPPTAVYIP